MNPQTQTSSEKEKQKAVCMAIVSQLGGNQFLTMTGTKIQYYDGYTTTFKLTRNKLAAKWMKITLNSADLYDIEFLTEKKTINKQHSIGRIKIYDTEVISIKTLSGYYDDMLRKMFEDETGLKTKLF